MIITFLYHSVSNSQDYRYAVTVDDFRRQLLAVKRKMNFLSAADLQQIVLSKKIPRGNFAIITFDDGYEDNFTNAFPILKELNIPAIIFISTKWIGSNFQGRKMLSWEQIKEMDRSGLIFFGNHTHSHIVLTTLTNENILNELREANSILEKELGKKIVSISYPKNKFNESVLNCSAKIYSFGFGGSGAVFNKIENNFLIPRINIGAGMKMFKFNLLPNKWFWRLKKIKEII